MKRFLWFAPFVVLCMASFLLLAPVTLGTASGPTQGVNGYVTLNGEPRVGKIVKLYQGTTEVARDTTNDYGWYDIRWYPGSYTVDDVCSSAYVTIYYNQMTGHDFNDDFCD